MVTWTIRRRHHQFLLKLCALVQILSALIQTLETLHCSQSLHTLPHQRNHLPCLCRQHRRRSEVWCCLHWKTFSEHELCKDLSVNLTVSVCSHRYIFIQVMDQQVRREGAIDCLDVSINSFEIWNSRYSRPCVAVILFIVNHSVGKLTSSIISMKYKMAKKQARGSRKTSSMFRVKEQSVHLHNMEASKHRTFNLDCWMYFWGKITGDTETCIVILWPNITHDFRKVIYCTRE